MELTIKGFKTFRGHDGNGFNATLLIDGVPCADVTDDGWGGGYQYETRRYGEKGKALLGELEAWVAEQPEIPFPEAGEGRTLKQDIDCFVCDAVDKAEQDKRLRRLCKTKTVVQFPDGNTYTWKVPYTPDFKELLLAKGTAPAGSVFLNEQYA